MTNKHFLEQYERLSDFKGGLIPKEEIFRQIAMNMIKNLPMDELIKLFNLEMLNPYEDKYPTAKEFDRYKRLLENDTIVFSAILEIP